MQVEELEEGEWFEAPVFSWDELRNAWRYFPTSKDTLSDKHTQVFSFARSFRLKRLTC